MAVFEYIKSKERSKISLLEPGNSPFCEAVASVIRKFIGWVVDQCLGVSPTGTTTFLFSQDCRSIRTFLEINNE